jgi:hypothetical protein
MEEAGLMTNLEYRQAEQALINWMQLIQEPYNQSTNYKLSDAYQAKHKLHPNCLLKLTYA